MFSLSFLALLGSRCVHCVYFGVPPFGVFIQFALIKKKKNQIGKAQIKRSKAPFCISFGIGLECNIGDSVTSLIDFVDWLGSL